MTEDQRIKQVAERMVVWFGNDTRRIHHFLKVHDFAKIIAEVEELSEEEREVAELCGLVHDIGIKISEQKYQSSAVHYQEQEGPALVRDLLSDMDYPESVIERVAYITGHHHSYHKIDGPDFQVLVEADFLVNIAEEEIGTDAQQKIFEKYFKTSAGRSLLNNIYK